MPQNSAQRLENYPPFKSMSIKVLELDPLWSRVRIELPLIEQNMNPGGSMFGGAIASLADPIAALACAKRFPDYAVWTKSLTVDFVRPGSGDLQLLFEFPDSATDEINADLSSAGRSDHSFKYGLYLDDGQLSARVSCVVAIRPAEPGSHRRGFRNKHPD